MSEQSDPQFVGLGGAFHENDSDATGKRREAENVQRVEQLLMLFVNGKYDELDDLLDENVQMEIMGPADAFMVGHHRGRPDVIDAIRGNFSLLEDQHPTIESVIAQGDQVVLVGKEEGRVRANGRSYEVSFVQIYTFKEGKIVSMRELADTAAWIAAAGRKE